MTGTTSPIENSSPSTVRGTGSDLKIVITADSASVSFGGEAIHPVHYFRILRSRGIEAWLVVHARTREELLKLFPNDQDRICTVPDTALHKLLWTLGRPLPHMIELFTLGLVSRMVTQWMQRRVIRRLVAEHGVNVVHQPIPLAPRECCLFYDLGAPFVVGPLNGGMTFPAAFRKRQSTIEAAFMSIGRWMSNLINYLIPGKLRAATVLVANERTAGCLPSGIRGRVVSLIDNSVDLATWQPAASVVKDPKAPAKFVYLGRLVGWKAVDTLLDSFKRVTETTGATLEIIGDGELRGDLEKQARDLGIASAVTFRGWVSQPEAAAALQSADALVLPSLYECGGAVVLEGMAVGLPVIATNWGGPADYLDDTCGILVEPSSRKAFIEGLSNAMIKLAKDPELRLQMGAAARHRIVTEFDWQKKVDRTLEIYEEAVKRSKPRRDPVENYVPASAG